MRKLQKVFFFFFFKDTFSIPPPAYRIYCPLQNLSSAVNLVIDGGYTISEASKFYKVPISKVSKGVKDALEKRHSKVNEMFKIQTKFMK